MVQAQINRLIYLCETVPDLLNMIPETEMSLKPAPGKWSKKQILGHLIDSAANNHQRFVRAQFENVPTVTYDQDKWNEFGYYQQTDTGQLIRFWTCYNLQLLALIKSIPSDKLKNECDTGGGVLSLAEIFIDYVSHLEHHLEQIRQSTTNQLKTSN